MCVDVYVDFSKDSIFKLLLSCLLQSYNLFHIVDFSTGFNNTSCSTIDYVFIDNSRVILFKVLPIINGLSDRDAYCLTLNIFFYKGYNLIGNRRLITKEQYQILLLC